MYIDIYIYVYIVLLQPLYRDVRQAVREFSSADGLPLLSRGPSQAKGMSIDDAGAPLRMDIRSVWGLYCGPARLFPRIYGVAGPGTGLLLGNLIGNKRDICTYK